MAFRFNAGLWLITLRLQSLRSHSSRWRLPAFGGFPGNPLEQMQQKHPAHKSTHMLPIRCNHPPCRNMEEKKGRICPTSERRAVTILVTLAGTRPYSRTIEYQCTYTHGKNPESTRITHGVSHNFQTREGCRACSPLPFRMLHGKIRLHMKALIFSS